jgi:hypothetical protein
MTRTFDEGVTGSALALVLASLGNGALTRTPVPAVYPESASVAAAGLTLALACLGAAVGIGLVRLAARRPAESADYDDAAGPPHPGGPSA